MKGKYNPYTLNVDLFNNTYRALGGIRKYLEMRLEGKSYKQLGKYFGFTPQRAHQIGKVLESEFLIPKRSAIESNFIRKIVKGVKHE